MNRRLKLPLILALLAVPVAACSMSWSDDDDQGVTPRGSGGERTYPVEGFETIELGAAGDVEVRVGGGYSVTATGTPAALDKVLVERDGKALKLSRRKGISWGSGDKVRFLVTMPRITGADIGGSGTITIDRVPGGSFEGNIGGSGRLDVRGLAVDKAEFAIGGSGDIAAAGTARSLEVSIGGSGKVRAQPLRAETGEITIAGAGDIQATVTRHAEVTIMGSGDVDITGGAKCSVAKMGGGKVNCG
ncbi:head GIN domain-containing protein [Sphingomonas sp. KR1UV-12]|uniref:Head GIN domain-containing protein n=1 Tax=Sphingomonas aurea TaxID=3063994 RepID=A0ABT9ENT7_9SPHN|nr:head GIN domain-containing protein [Sphingomonas sp. KR1UV-12]MDP1028614.1 head GIN domain-containing protein [Sphingomonas sp. KR1UV-12]